MIGKSRFAVFGELSATYGESRQDFTFYSLPGPYNGPGGNSSKSQTFNVALKPGLVYFFTPHISAETMFGNFGYSHTKTSNFDRFSKKYNEVNDVSFNTSLSFAFSALYIGVNFYFGGPRASSVLQE